MCGYNRHRGGSDGRKALVPESREAGTGALLEWPREAPAGRDRRGFPMSSTIERQPGEPITRNRAD